MSNLQLYETYEDEYQKTKELLEKKQSLPESFCAFFNELQTISPDPVAQKQVQTLFQDVNQEIEKYNEQFQILIKELGVLCAVNSDKGNLNVQFFQSLLDLFGLAHNTYSGYPDRLQLFLPLLIKLRIVLETQRMKLEEDPLQKALLLQLTKSAWALTQTNRAMEYHAKLQQKGGNRRRTRKHSRVSA